MLFLSCSVFARCFPVPIAHLLGDPSHCLPGDWTTQPLHPRVADAWTWRRVDEARGRKASKSGPSAGRRPFAGGLQISKRIFANLRSRGVLVYPGSGTADGVSGDHILVAPPFIIEYAEIDWLARQIGEAVTEVCDGAATGAHSG